MKQLVNIFLGTTLISSLGIAEATAPSPLQSETEKIPKPFFIKIPNTTLSVQMRPVNIKKEDKLIHIWVSEKEITWELYDAFVFKQDRAQEKKSDSIARPTKPYMTADRGWGHAGFPVISVSPKGALAFANWISNISNKKIRIPKVSEWKAIWDAGKIDSRRARMYGWTKENSEKQTHRCATMSADINGIYDMLGNVGEWCLDKKQNPVLVGGSWKDPGKSCGPNLQLIPDSSWNATDPQLPKSIWWLADASWAGFRVVCDDLKPFKKIRKEPKIENKENFNE